MNGRYSIRREAEGLSMPFGANGAAAIGSLIGAVAGLLVPRAMLESVAFQLYLDTVIPSAKAPLGATAQLVAAVMLAIAGVMAGYLVAWIFGITASPGGLSGLLARLRGELAEDEEDAPPLRSADRHPDAPARRPFSAARDIPNDVGMTIDAVAQPRFVEEDDELLLDLPVAEDRNEPDDMTDFAVNSDNDTAPINPEGATGLVDAMDGFDLSPPTLDDWETGSFYDEPDAAVEPVEEPELLMPAESEPEPVMAYTPPPPRAAPPPLDLSAARLNELIARLEAGLTRKVAGTPPPAVHESFDMDAETLVSERPAPPPASEPDPAFPHDPALAAALATLRKMNLRSV